MNGVNNGPLVSVIVPVYKVERELPGCVESLLGQTYENLEILLVDDGSPDRCGELCDRYAEREARIRVIHKENGGLSDARNAAIDQMRGEYVTFVDSDDLVSPRYVEHLVDALQKYEADMAVSAIRHTFARNREEWDAGVPECRLFETQEALEDMLYQRHIDNSACAKLYRSDAFQTVRYPAGRLYEDLATTYKLIDASRRVVYVGAADYRYFQRVGSIVHQAFEPRKMDAVTYADEIRRFVEQRYPALLPAADCRVLSVLFSVWLQIPPDDAAHRTVADGLWVRIRGLRGAVLRNRQARRKTRLACLASYGGRTLLRALFAAGRKA